MKLSRRRLFASAVAGALLHVLKPLDNLAGTLKAVEPAKDLTVVLNPDYVNAEYEVYFMCNSNVFDGITTTPDPATAVPVFFKRREFGGSFTNPDNTPYPPRFHLTDEGTFTPIPPTITT